MTFRFLGNKGMDIGKDHDRYGVGVEGKARGKDRCKKRKDRRNGKD